MDGALNKRRAIDAELVTLHRDLNGHVSGITDKALVDEFPLVLLDKLERISLLDAYFQHLEALLKHQSASSTTRLDSGTNLARMKQKERERHLRDQIRALSREFVHLMNAADGTKTQEDDESLKTFPPRLDRLLVSATASQQKGVDSLQLWNIFNQLTHLSLQLRLLSPSDKTDEEIVESVALILQPYVTRFWFHFDQPSRETTRIDRPEWYLSQVLQWIKFQIPVLVQLTRQLNTTTRSQYGRYGKTDVFSLKDEFVRGLVQEVQKKIKKDMKRLMKTAEVELESTKSPTQDITSEDSNKDGVETKDEEEREQFDGWWTVSDHVMLPSYSMVCHLVREVIAFDTSLSTFQFPPPAPALAAPDGCGLSVITQMKPVFFDHWYVSEMTMANARLDEIMKPFWLTEDGMEFNPWIRHFDPSQMALSQDPYQASESAIGLMDLLADYSDLSRSCNKPEHKNDFVELQLDLCDRYLVHIQDDWTYYLKQVLQDVLGTGSSFVNRGVANNGFLGILNRTHPQTNLVSEIERRMVQVHEELFEMIKRVASHSMEMLNDQVQIDEHSKGIFLWIEMILRLICSVNYLSQVLGTWSSDSYQTTIKQCDKIVEELRSLLVSLATGWICLGFSEFCRVRNYVMPQFLVTDDDVSGGAMNEVEVDVPVTLIRGIMCMLKTLRYIKRGLPHHRIRTVPSLRSSFQDEPSPPSPSETSLRCPLFPPVVREVILRFDAFLMNQSCAVSTFSERGAQSYRAILRRGLDPLLSEVASSILSEASAVELGKKWEDSELAKGLFPRLSDVVRTGAGLKLIE